MSEVEEKHEPQNPCPVCGREDPQRPMCFRGEPWCSDRCRKVINEEVEPTQQEYMTMSQELLLKLRTGIVIMSHPTVDNEKSRED